MSPFFLLSILTIQALELRESENFKFYLGSRDLILLEGASQALENCSKKASDLFGISIQGKTPVFVYNGVKAFSQATKLEEDIIRRGNIIGMAKFNRLMIITPEALAFGYAWQDSLCHEYIHHFLKTGVSEVLPLWFQEGFARRWETIWRGKTDFELNFGDKEEIYSAAAEKRLVSFESMEPSLVYLKDSAEIGLAFSEVALAIENLSMKKSAKLSNFLSELTHEKDFKKAFKNVYGKEFGDFESELFAEWSNLAQSTPSLKASGALSSMPYFGDKKDHEKISLGPSASALVVLGDKMRVRGNLSRAQSFYLKALQEEPKNPYILSRYVRACLSLGNLEEAMIKAKEMVGANPQWAPGWELLGSLSGRADLWDEALEAYKNYLKYNPFHFDLYKRIISIYWDRGDYGGAQPYIAKALILEPQDPELEAFKDKLSSQEK